MPNTAKELVYLSDAQYQELVSNGSIVVGGITVTYNADNIYVTPQQEPYILPINGIPVSDLADDMFASDAETQVIIDEYGMDEEDEVTIFDMNFDDNLIMYVSEEDASLIVDAYTSGKKVRLHFNETETSKSYYAFETWADVLGYRPVVDEGGTYFPEGWVFGVNGIGEWNSITPTDGDAYTNSNGKLVIQIDAG